MFGFLTFGTTLTFLDLALKGQIEAQEKEKFPRELSGSRGLIKLYQNHNPGFSFGFLKEKPRAVELVPLCITSALAGMWTYVCSCRGRLLKKLGLTLALAGGVSNLYDRMKRGYVVDYFSIQWGLLKKVVFNLGDICILLGAALFMLSEMLECAKEKK
ncbi:MAG: signal peptidase II [Lachnospiraceae bacterium]|nr:signal peptidase II [Lachnospiraceae bacterium]